MLRNPDGLRVVLDGENGNQISLQSNDYLVFEDLNWHLVGFTYDGVNLLLYIDGEQVKSLEGIVNISQISNLASIGNHNTAMRPLVGAVDDLRVYDRVVTANDILKLFNE